MRRFISVILIASFSITFLSPAVAAAAATTDAQTQEVEPSTGAVPAEAGDAQRQAEAAAFLECRSIGERDGAAVSTGGSFAGGLGAGVLLGLIGTAIAYVAQGEPEPTSASLMALNDNACRQAYTDAYKSKGRSEKRSAALGGGLLGTAIIVAVLLTTSGD